MPQNEEITQDYNSRLFDKIAVVLTVVPSSFQLSYLLIDRYWYSVYSSVLRYMWVIDQK